MIALLILAVSMPMLFASSQEEAVGEVKNPDTFVYVSYGTVDSLDPAKAYDNASGGCIQNMNETLIAFKGESTTEFVPVLAEEVPTVENGGILDGGKTYRFKIRKGVKFHSGNPLTPEDVKYSFLRAMVVDPPGGPTWLISFPLLGTYSSREGSEIVADFAAMDAAIEVDGDYVQFNLRAPFAPFLSTLAGYWCTIIDKKFVAANGGWDGTEATWKDHNGPEEGKETLYEIVSGTGPFKLGRWEKGVELVMERNENYWGTKPSVSKAIYKVVDEWATRKLMLLQGDADAATVDPLYYSEMNQESGLTIYKELRSLGLRGINFNQAIESTDNPYIGSGKLDGKGVPGDFFTDVNVRTAFMHVWDQETYISDILDHAGATVATPLVPGLPFYNEKLKAPEYDLDKAAEFFKKAFDGQLWANGFEFDILYNTGNEVRESSCKMIAENLLAVNPKFKVNVRAIDWAVILDLQRQKRLPMYYMGWGADYPDPDNFMQPYMHSQGLFAQYGGYNNPEADALVEAGAIETDNAKRKEIYYRLQDLWLEDAVGICMHQPIGNRYFKDWVKGYVWHPMENQYVYSQFSKE